MVRKCLLTSSLLLVVIVSLLLGTEAALADEPERSGEAVRLLTTIPIPANLKPLIAFDISWLDPQSQLYYLGDRSNASVDVVDARTNRFVKAIPGNFRGVAFKDNPSNPPGGRVADNDRSGPNGVVVAGHWLFVTDASSRVVTIDLKNDQIVAGGDVSTGGADALRADELAYDPRDGILLVVNNADDPPFATLVSVDRSTGRLTPGARITLNNANGVDATNGAEQPVWDPGTGKFYLSIPEIGGPGGGGPVGAVVRIDPHSHGAVEKVFLVNLCQPAGLTLGPNQDLLLGCSQAFDTAGQAWASGDKNSAVPISVIMDATTGRIDKNVLGVSGSDEVWFNPGDGRYYLAARANPTGPVLGVIDAESQILLQVVPTANAAAKPTATPPVPAGTAHSLAVDPHTNNVFVPLPANNVFPDCLNGCIAVYGTSRGDDD